MCLVVAPLVGAWIETYRSIYGGYRSVSHPSWVRGLKRSDKVAVVILERSHPSWVRGLKHVKHS